MTLAWGVIYKTEFAMLDSLPRRCFYVRQCSFREGETVARSDVHAKRLVAADGRFNFRDIGGYATTDGRITRWGHVYRSGVMAHFTEAGCAALAKLGIRVICDLRTTREREEAPTRWQDAGVADYWSRDYDLSRGELSRMMERDDLAAGEVRNAMITNYRTLAFEQAESYKHLFARLADGHVPLVFNCSAGKDRTGVAAALLLALLGVPRDTIVADYALTNEIMALDGKVLVERGIFRGGWRTDPAFQALIAADPAYIEAMFESLDKECGSVENFVERELGVSQSQADAIRASLLETA